VLLAAIIGLVVWYLARPEPLLVQGEVESTRIDIAVRVSSRLVTFVVVFAVLFMKRSVAEKGRGIAANE
jgi:hypothetical protein